MYSERIPVTKESSKNIVSRRAWGYMSYTSWTKFSKN